MCCSDTLFTEGACVVVIHCLFKTHVVCNVLFYYSNDLTSENSVDFVGTMMKYRASFAAFEKFWINNEKINMTFFHSMLLKVNHCHLMECN